MTSQTIMTNHPRRPVDRAKGRYAGCVATILCGRKMTTLTHTTLESLYRDRPDSAEYDAARRAKLAAIATYAAGHIRPDVDARRLAESLMASVGEMGRFSGDTISGEIAGRYTITGNPLPFTL